MKKAIYFLLIVCLGLFSSCSDTKKQEKIPEKTYMANEDVKKVFDKLQVGIDREEFNKVIESSTAHIELWHVGDDGGGSKPIIENFSTEDKICFYTPKAIIPSSGSNVYFAIDRANMIAIAIDKDKECWGDDDYYIKSLLLISRKSYMHYSIVEQKHYDILKDPKLKKYNDGIAKAKRLHKPMVLVLYGYYKPHNTRLQNALKSPTLKRLIEEKFVFVEYLFDEAGHLERTQIGDIHFNPNTFVFDKNGKYKTRIPGAIGVGTSDYDKYVKVLESVVNE